MTDWSHTRHAAHARCPRQYWYRYHAVGEEIYFLKRVEGRQAWTGKLVHEAIAALVRADRGEGATLPFPALLGPVLGRMRADYTYSKTGMLRTFGKGLRLLEHEYAHPMTREEWRRSAGAAEVALRTFYDSTIRREISTAAQALVEERAEITIEGHKCLLVVDCAKGEHNGERTIYDWKTGSDETDVGLQLGVYALWATMRFSVPAEAVQAVEFNLRENHVRRYTYTEKDLWDVRERIVKSIAKLEKGGEDEASYPRVEDLSVCASCAFARVCRPGEAIPLRFGNVQVSA